MPERIPRQRTAEEHLQEAISAEKSAEVDRTFHPDEANTGLYRRFYTERMSVVKGMKDVFGTLKAMGGLR